MTERAEQAGEPVLRNLLGQLRRATGRIEERGSGSRAGTSRAVTGTTALLGIEMAVAVLARAMEAMSDAEAVERAKVYALAAEHLAPLVGGDETAVFAALVHLCGEPADGLGAAPADPAVESALRQVIVRMVVTYDLATVGSVWRTVEIWHDIDGPGLNRREIRQPVAWDDVPADVRERRLQRGEQTTSFQLFP